MPYHYEWMKTKQLREEIRITIRAVRYLHKIDDDPEIRGLWRILLRDLLLERRRRRSRAFFHGPRARNEQEG